MRILKASDFDYDLPEDFIAQDPAFPRDSSKLMVCGDGHVLHNSFSGIVDFLNAGDVLVVNRSKVIPARILFDDSGSEREIFLLKKVDASSSCTALYQVLVRPGRSFKVGSAFNLGNGLSCSVLEILEDGSRIVRFNHEIDLNSAIEKAGQAPLPPYITKSKADFSKYQTVYAKESGSVAAPTAGLHFTDRLLERLRAKGVTIEEVILHVGRGTFLPVSSELIEDHVMHAEFYELHKDTAARLNTAKKEGRRIVAVGTTSVRVLESSFSDESSSAFFVPGARETDIFIYPGKYKWKAVDALVTDFHLPKSTLIMLVASFLENKGSDSPIEDVLKLYELAKQNGYKFYSFGDAMFLF